MQEPVVVNSTQTQPHKLPLDAAVSAYQFNSLTTESSSSSSDGPFKGDMQNLLPQSTRLSEDSLSRTSVISNSDAGISADEKTPSGCNSLCNSSADSPPCDLSLIERLLFTHPVWFLPGIQRSGAIHFLQSKEEGNFIVRGSSQPNTMAVSVRLPPNAGPYIEHYLIQSINGTLCLESSRFKFDSIPALIAHYSQCCDELPVQLVLPNALRTVKNRQQLSSLALLGQEFWRYPMSSAKPNKQQPQDEACLLDAKSPISTTDTSGLGTTLFSDSNTNCILSTGLESSAKVCSIDILSSSANTPSDTTCSMSSFATNCHQIQSVRSDYLDSAKMNSPAATEMNKKPFNGSNGILLKCNENKSDDILKVKSFENNKLLTSIIDDRANRPKPPNTLNFDLRRAPAPPLTWWKPFSPSNYINNTNRSLDKTENISGCNNFTVTTTVTFSMDKDNTPSPQFLDVVSPDNNRIFNSTGNSYITFQTFSKRLSPEGECKDSFSSHDSFKNNKNQPNDNKESGIALTDKISTMKLRRGAKHYRESDILQSPEIYCQNLLNGKITDYDDLWLHDTGDRIKLLSSFKAPTEQQGKRPDLLPESARIICHNNLMAIDNETTTTTTTSISTNAFPPQTHQIQTNIQSNSIISNNETKHDDQFREVNLQNSFKENHSIFKNHSDIEDNDSNDDIEEDDDNDKADVAVEDDDDEGDAHSTENLIMKSDHSSSFYAEPADTVTKLNTSGIMNVLRRPQKDSHQPISQRHSEPFTGSCFMRTPTCLKFITSEIDKVTVSLDELENNEEKYQQRQQQQQSQQQQQKLNENKQKPLAKQSQRRFEQWQLDSSWEFMPKIRNNEDYTYDNNFSVKESKNDSTNSIINNNNSNSTTNNSDEKLKPITIHEIIAKRLPDFNLSELTASQCQKTNNHLQNSAIVQQKKDSNDPTNSRLSSYDNVERSYNPNSCFFSGLESSQSDDGTVFSEPWDSIQWEIISPQQGFHTRNKIITCRDGPGEAVRNYTLNLAQDLTTTFARNIENFICCTKESRESVPQIVMRNMRQFMNGMKNYLVKHGENQFHQEVEAARKRLKATEFLNLDAILETVMHQLVILPLREHLYGMFVDHYTRTNDLQLLAQNVKYACGRKACDFGVRSVIRPPSNASLQIISSMLVRFQESELPLEKLDIFLCVISTIFETSTCPRGQQLTADDFLPILVYVVAKCGFIGAEIEAEFIWGLLQPTILNGESGYYLTALCSAVHVLKNFMNFKSETPGLYDLGPSSMPDHLSSVLRVIIPDECVGSLQTRTLPVRPHTTTREVCRIIAHKARITNPQDYGLFKLVDGDETILNETECPQNIRTLAKDKQCTLVYKRLDAKIVWPTSTQNFAN